MNVLVYANVGLNLIDGSTIWVLSITEILSETLGCNVTVLSRDNVEQRGVVPALQKLSNVRIVQYSDFPEVVQSHPKPGDRYGMEKIVRKLDASKRFDRFIIRDPDVALVLARVVSLHHRVWAYVLDSPVLDAAGDRSLMGELLHKAGGILVQSSTQRALLEAVFPQACNKASVLPPMIKPVSVPADSVDRGTGKTTVRFIYSGKYSKDWNVEAFFDLPAACANRGLAAAVTMAGDKVHNEKSDPDFRKRILEKFETTPGVKWLGAMEREAAIREAAQHDLGLCWRTEALDDSLEISTKFLEFASVGVPSVVNRTAAYEHLLGGDYPYFANTMEDVVAAAGSVLADPNLHERMRAKCQVLASAFTYDRAADRLRQALLMPEPSAQPRKPSAVGPLKKRLIIATHDMKFLEHALGRITASGDYHIFHDKWRSTTSHDSGQSAQLLEKADIIFCEWCVGQAVWYSHRKRPDQKLFVRLHRFEAYMNFPKEVLSSALDGVIVVSDHFREICIRDFGWPADRIVVLPQYCLADQLRRDKYPGADNTLGFVGINGFHHKRFDRAIEILRLVRKRAPEFRLRIRSAMPWEFDWIWKDNLGERAKFEAVFREINADTDLREHVIFDRPGANMAEWYRNIGYILSTSETEGCHTSVAEGICSGAVPVIIDWPGAASVYGEENVYKSVEEMANTILAIHAKGDRHNAFVQERGAREFDIAKTVAKLEEMFAAA